MKHLLHLSALTLSVLVVFGCNGKQDSAPTSPTSPAPVAVPVRATLAQQEQCAHDAERFAPTRVVDIDAPKPSVITSHFDTSSGRCVVLLDLHAPSMTFKQLYDANEKTRLAELRLGMDYNREYVSDCWVADQTGVHQDCTSPSTGFDGLLKKYYGVQEQP